MEYKEFCPYIQIKVYFRTIPLQIMIQSAELTMLSSDHGPAMASGNHKMNNQSTAVEHKSLRLFL